MRIINIIGVFLFLYFGILYNSYRCYIIFINGVIFHSNETNIYLRYYDIMGNAIFTIYTIYYYPKTRPYAIIATASWITNTYCNNYHFYSDNISDIIHVLFTQYILCYALVNYSID